MLTDHSSHDDDSTRELSVARRLRSTERLRRLAEIWPALEDQERIMLETHLHRLREKASV